jgi:prepilin-type N-terminal cleavage/methylation domain-containing protein
MKSNNYGFTLLEVLLALSILSLVLLISNYSLKQLTNSKINLDKKLEFVKRTDLFFSHLGKNCKNLSNRTFQKKEIIEISDNFTLYSSVLDSFRGRTNIKTSLMHNGKTIYLQTIKDLNLNKNTSANHIKIIENIDKIGFKFFFSNSGWTDYFYLNNQDNSLVINPYQLKAIKILLQPTDFKKPFMKILKCSLI